MQVTDLLIKIALDVLRQLSILPHDRLNFLCTLRLSALKLLCERSDYIVFLFLVVKLQLMDLVLVLSLELAELVAAPIKRFLHRHLLLALHFLDFRSELILKLAQLG